MATGRTVRTRHEKLEVSAERALRHVQRGPRDAGRAVLLALEDLDLAHHLEPCRIPFDPGQQLGDRLVFLLARRHQRVPERQPALVAEQDEPQPVDEAVLRLRVAKAGAAGEAAALCAAGVVGDPDQRPVGKPSAAQVEPGGEPLLHGREQPDQATQAPVVLRLRGQVREPARQDPLDQAEELTVGTDPGRGLADRERDQLRVARLRRSARPGSDHQLVREHVACNDKRFQIGRHLELLSRRTRLEALFLLKQRVPAQTHPVSHQASRSAPGSRSRGSRRFRSPTAGASGTSPGSWARARRRSRTPRRWLIRIDDRLRELFDAYDIPASAGSG